MNYNVSYQKHGVTFSPSQVSARVMMFPFATDAELIEKVLDLGENQHHAWGVKELLAEGIEVTVANRYSRFWERFGQDWLLSDTHEYDLIYSNHNLLIRTVLESTLGLRKTPFVSLVYAGEALLAPNRHFGLLCMTPYAHSRFQSLKSVRVRYAPWGIDPESALHQIVQPSGEHHISTGVTGRDFDTLIRAAELIDESLIIAARGQNFSTTPANVRVIDEVISPWGIRDLYKGAYSGLVILKRDDSKRTAVGWTNMLELMAVGLPIIKTRTSSLDDIVNIETIGAGILVEPENPEALAAAMMRLRDNPELRLAMGRAGAEYVRSHLTMQQFAKPLIELVMATRSAK
ncbi:glycosyltransferase [Nostoc sp. TCL26-01]|uniref:glycosyltransferase n=1 Tax=Nostoc sp. TCL26-01 TaxID=2576904 RepID=UPI0015BF8749|nr:glycosyltransferase [Nostoc sp. TCL26-01]QLE58463.1 glycosyltransferase family 4 protein [Nostoc sp. TCL26-01]